ncbi:MAG: cytochrome c [Novosphingobium sp.]
MKKTPIIVLAIALTACGNPDTPGGRAADSRHENFEQLGDTFKVVGDQLKSGSPDMAAIRKAASDIAATAPKLESWFPQGSSKADGLRTHALQAVWDKPDEFKQAAAKFVDEANAFKALADSGDAAAVGNGMKALGGACKGCHDKFKEAD